MASSSPCPAPHKTLGDVTNPGAKVVRIVHISDTHMEHMTYLNQGLIPNGDILIHSGDFADYSPIKYIRTDRNYCLDVENVDAFFSLLPHKHKIFVAGNHELNFTKKNPNRTRHLLKNGIYLQDSSVVLEGLKIYGSPWNIRRESSYARGFAVKPSILKERWRKIPTDVDILVTHSPPSGIMDHKGVLGCERLREHVLTRIRPKAHLFGHAHGERRRLLEKDGILFSNAAMMIDPKPTVIDYYIEPEKCMTVIPENDYKPTKTSCVIM